MAHAHTVIRSIETPDGFRCVDIFLCSDGSYGFAEYRRDPEDGRGWQPAGACSEGGIPTETEALERARQSVAWLGEVSS